MFYKLLYMLKIIMLLNPILLFILLFFILFLIIRNMYFHFLLLKKRSLHKKQKIHRALNFLYISNFSSEIYTLQFLLSITIGFMFLFRYFNFGKTLNIWLVNGETIFTIKNIILISIFIFIFTLYMSYLTDILKYKIYKIYLYFIHFYYGEKILIHLHNKIITNMPYYTHVLFYIKQFLPKNSNALKYLDNNSLEYKLLFYLRKKMLNKNKFITFIEKLNDILEKNYYILNIEETLRKYFFISLVYITLLYDLKHNEIKYFYYIISIYSLFILYNKVRKVISEYDLYEIDLKLATYFYKKNNNTNTLEIFDMFDTKIKPYIERNYRIEYIDINFKKSYEPYSMRIIYISVLVFYFIFCYNISWLNCLLITLPLLLSYIIYEYTFKYQVNLKRIKIYQVIYVILLFLAIILMVYIYLTRHTYCLMNDHFWFLGLQIKQTFTLEEKYSFFLKYMHYILNNDKGITSLEKEKILAIILNIKIENILMDYTTILNIKDYINYLIEITIRLNNAYINHSDDLFEKTVQQLNIEKIYLENEEDNILIICLIFLIKFFIKK